MALYGETVLLRTSLMWSTYCICCYRLYRVNKENLPCHCEKNEVEKSVSFRETAKSIMPGDGCIVCKKSRTKDPNTSFHRFPVEPTQRAKWLRALHLEEHQAKPHLKVCCRHFPGGDANLGLSWLWESALLPLWKKEPPGLSVQRQGKKHSSFWIDS